MHTDFVFRELMRSHNLKFWTKSILPTLEINLMKIGDSQLLNVDLNFPKALRSVLRIEFLSKQLQLSLFLKKFVKLHT